MQNRHTIAFVLLSFILCFVGSACNNIYKQQFEQSGNNLGERTIQDIIERDEARSYGYTGNLNANQKTHRNKQLHLNQYTSTQIGRMEGVGVAHIFITDRHAYVGMVLDNTATGHAESGTGRKSTDPGRTPSIYNGRDAFLEAQPGQMVDDWRKKFTYPNNEQISSKLRQKVANKVRQLNPHVEQVFISANADFINELNAYAIRYWSGEPLESYAEDFNALVEHYFPLQ